MKIASERKIAVLKLARKKLARSHGWVKGTYKDRKWDKNKEERFAAYCLAGACTAAFNELYREPKGLNKVCFWTDTVANALSLKDSVKEKGYDHIPAFNDDPKTRKKDVLAVIDAKLAELESAES